jgi:hypothetical protein
MPLRKPTPQLASRVSPHHPPSSIAIALYLLRLTFLHEACLCGACQFLARAASSAAVMEACPIETAPIKSERYLLSRTSSAGCGDCFDPDRDPWWRTLLTVLTVFANVVRILMTLLPARPLTQGNFDVQGPQEGLRAV